MKLKADGILARHNHIISASVSIFHVASIYCFANSVIGLGFEDEAFGGAEGGGVGDVFAFAAAVG
jgi:hypothetical protein